MRRWRRRPFKETAMIKIVARRIVRPAHRAILHTLNVILYANPMAVIGVLFLAVVVLTIAAGVWS